MVRGLISPPCGPRVQSTVSVRAVNTCLVLGLLRQHLSRVTVGILLGLNLLVSPLTAFPQVVGDGTDPGANTGLVSRVILPFRIQLTILLQLKDYMWQFVR